MKYLIVLLTAALLTACATPFSSEPNADNSQRPSMEQLGRMPLPVGTKLRTAESLIFGVGEGWLGRAVFELPNDATSSYNFFAEQLPRQGWTMIASVRGKKSLLVFTRADRAATIEVEDSGLFSASLASMTVSPVGSTGGAPAGAGVVVRPLSDSRAASRRRVLPAICSRAATAKARPSMGGLISGRTSGHSSSFRSNLASGLCMASARWQRTQRHPE